MAPPLAAVVVVVPSGRLPPGRPGLAPAPPPARREPHLPARACCRARDACSPRGAAISRPANPPSPPPGREMSKRASAEAAAEPARRGQPPPPGGARASSPPALWGPGGRGAEGDSAKRSPAKRRSKNTAAEPRRRRGGPAVAAGLAVSPSHPGIAREAMRRAPAPGRGGAGPKSPRGAVLLAPPAPCSAASPPPQSPMFETRIPCPGKKSQGVVAFVEFPVPKLSESWRVWTSDFGAIDAKRRWAPPLRLHHPGTRQCHANCGQCMQVERWDVDVVDVALARL